ncbi:hypothetical protein C3L33_03642, partial [Rhododendron williamsianum]
MAVEAILGIIAQKAADIAVNQLIKESSRLSRVKEDLLWIETEMRRIQSYLEDAEAMQPKTKRVSNFIRDMWDLAYDVEDILDTYFPKMRSSRSRWKGLLGCSNLITARRFAKDVEDIKKRVDDITRLEKLLKLMKAAVPKVLDEDLHDHRVVSIIGNAGLGKTTLARKVYNSVRQHFGCSAWICVSQQPNYKELLRDVARQVGLEKEKIKQGVESNLFAFLSGKRYAIVIDDIWHTKAWDALKVGLPMNSENGSRIILTSRNTKVGVHADSPQLEHIGEQILERCGGVPLAIVLRQGFIRGSGVREVEEVGDDYLNHLIARNLIQVVRRRFDGRVRVVRIHDMLHSLCIKKANEINFFVIHMDATTNCNASLKLRRVAIHGGDIGHYLSLNPQTSRVRAMLCFLGETQWNGSVTKNLLSDSKFLQVLRIDDHYIPRSLLTEICNLRQLTYLKLSWSGVELPYAISNLKSLLTLDLQESWRVYLPDIIWIEFSLTNIQTLYGLPGKIFKADWLHNLTNLRTLRVNDPTKDIMEVLSMDETPVSHKLETLRLYSFRRTSETNSVNLSRYENLRKLHLYGITMSELPQHDKLPPNLTKISLWKIRLEKDPMDTLKKLQKLKILKLGYESYMGKELVCSGEPGR